MRYASAPLLGLHLRVENSGDEEIRSVMLQCQIRIETTRRDYSPEEQRRLRDLFGDPERWGRTLSSMLWTNTAVVIPPFREHTAVDLPVPCTFDMTVATTKFFNAIESGFAPLSSFSAARYFTRATAGLRGSDSLE